MGGRGASAAGSAGGGFVATATNEVAFPGGETAQFDGELRYGEKDPTLSPTVRQNVEAWEEKRANAKVEYAYSVDADGNPIGPEVRGGKGSVRTPSSYHNTEDATFTHIHPREANSGTLGGTFSQGDLINFATKRNTTERAVAREGTYSISKLDNFDQAGFLAYVRNADRNFDREYRTATRQLTSSIRNGSISYDDYLAQNARAFNTALVNLHNAYIAGQQQYGYTYTLEQR